MINFSTFRKRLTPVSQHSPYSQRVKAPILRSQSLNPNRRTFGARKIGSNQLSFRKRQGINKPINA